MDLGRAYVRLLWVRDKAAQPLIQRTTSDEYEKPFRRGSALVIRVGRRALALGWWGAADSSLAPPLAGRPMGWVDADDIREWDS